MSSHKNLTIVTPPEDFGQFKNYGRSIFDSNNEGSTTTTATEGSTDSGILGKLMVPMSTPAPLNCAMPPTEAATPLGGNSLGSPRRNRVMSIYRTDVSPTKQHKAVVPIDYTPPVVRIFTFPIQIIIYFDFQNNPTSATVFKNKHCSTRCLDNPSTFF